MAVQPIPSISKQNYELMRKIVPQGLPTTYAEWEAANLLLIRAGRGQSFFPIEVVPKEFFGYCSGKGITAPTMDTVKTFVVEKFAQMEKTEKAKGADTKA